MSHHMASSEIALPLLLREEDKKTLSFTSIYNSSLDFGLCAFVTIHLTVFFKPEL